MKVAVLGAGAIGAYVGAALHRAGADVHLVARGPHLAAMRQHGVQVRSPRGDFTARAHATDDPSGIGPVDYVFLGLKANSYAACGPLIEPAAAQLDGRDRGPERHPLVVLPPARRPARRAAHRERGPGRRGQCGARARAGHRLCRLRGDGARRPGVVRHLEGTRFSIGEPDRSVSDRCLAFSQAMHAGGLKCPVEPELRGDIWIKLLGNISFNPISALSRATMRQMCLHGGTRRVIEIMMTETLAVAGAWAAGRTSPSNGAWPGPSASATTAPRHSRTWSAANRSNSTCCSRPSWNSRRSPASRSRRSAPSTPSRICSPTA